MFKLISLTAASIMTAEALVRLFLEAFADRFSLLQLILLDSTLLMICVFPTFYFLIFKEMAEQIRLRSQAEQRQSDKGEFLELQIQERTERLQRANEDLLVEVQERARSAMALRTALNEAHKGGTELRAVIDALPDAVAVVDKQWLVLAVNRPAEAMFSRGSYDLQGCALGELLLSPSRQSPLPEDFFPRGEKTPSLFFLADGGGAMQNLQSRCAMELSWNGRGRRPGCSSSTLGKTFRSLTSDRFVRTDQGKHHVPIRTTYCDHDPG